MPDPRTIVAVGTVLTLVFAAAMLGTTVVTVAAIVEDWSLGRSLW